MTIVVITESTVTGWTPCHWTCSYVIDTMCMIL